MQSIPDLNSLNNNIVGVGKVYGSIKRENIKEGSLLIQIEAKLRNMMSEIHKMGPLMVNLNLVQGKTSVNVNRFVCGTVN